MKRLLLLIIFPLYTFSQKNYVSVETNYQILLGNNHIEDNFNSKLNLQIKYAFLTVKKLKLGTGVSYSYLDNIKKNLNNYDIETQLRIFQPFLFIETTDSKFQYFFELGATINKYDFQGSINNINYDSPYILEDNNSDSIYRDIKRYDTGVTTSIGIKYLITTFLYFQIKYNHSFLINHEHQYIPNKNYYKSTSILNLGLGIKF